jgi:hypothetical protein
VSNKDRAPEQGNETERLIACVERLEKTVQRFVVVLERQLAANDAIAHKSQQALEKLHPEMARIQAEVRAKMRKRA